MTKRTAGKIFLGFLSFAFLLVIGILVMEIALRISNKYPVVGIQYNNTEIWHWHKNLNSTTHDEESGSFVQHTDKFGFRNYGKDYAKSDNTFRILIIGDSYTAGLTHADDKIFTALLEKKLEGLNVSGKKIEVFNMACPAWGAEQQFLVLKNYGLFAKPDYVLIMTCPNDIRETYNKRFAYLQDGVVKFNPIPFTKSEILKWKLACYSNLYQYLQAQVFKTNYGTFDMLMNKFRFNFGKEDADSWDRPMFLKQSFPELDEAWQLYFTLIEDAGKLCATNGIKFAVSSTPFLIEYNGAMQKDTTMQPGIVAEKIGGFCQSKGIPYVNLYDRFKNEKDPVSLFRPNDEHFNARGHEVTAEGLAVFFKEDLK